MFIVKVLTAGWAGAKPLPGRQQEDEVIVLNTTEVD